jgi:hypothetical protein
LGAVVREYMNNPAVQTNARSVTAFAYHVKNLLRRTLKRRRQKGVMAHEWMDRIAAAYLSRPRILHAWPNTRFTVKHQRWGLSA